VTAPSSARRRTRGGSAPSLSSPPLVLVVDALQIVVLQDGDAHPVQLLARDSAGNQVLLAFTRGLAAAAGAQLGRAGLRR
jgi:hypothetical protein